MGEYQENYDLNTSRKEDRVSEMNSAIQAQVDYIKEMQNIKAVKQELMRRFYYRSQAHFIKRKVFAALKYRYQVYKRIQRMQRCLLAAKNRRRL